MKKIIYLATSLAVLLALPFGASAFSPGLGLQSINPETIKFKMSSCKIRVKPAANNSVYGKLANCTGLQPMIYCQSNAGLRTAEVIKKQNTDACLAQGAKVVPENSTLVDNQSMGCIQTLTGPNHGVQILYICRYVTP